MAAPLIDQLRFTRAEWLRALRGVPDADALRRLEPMNSIGWIVGHLAWQEQRYFLTFAQGLQPFPDIAKEFSIGAPASEPPLDHVMKAWRAITAEADPWLDGLTSAELQSHVITRSKPTARVYGNLLQRVIYHYWYHTGETMAMRQMLGHPRLPQFVGNIDDEAPYRPDRGEIEGHRA